MGESQFLCVWFHQPTASSLHSCSTQVSLENGLVLNYDARTLPSDNSSLARPRFTLAAHDGATPGLDVNPHIRGCLVTGGTDKLVKIWNVLGDNEGDGTTREVSLITSRDLGVVCNHLFHQSLLLICTYREKCSQWCFRPTTHSQSQRPGLKPNCKFGTWVRTQVRGKRSGKSLQISHDH